MLIRFGGTEFDSSVLTLIRHTKRPISVYLAGLEMGRGPWILGANESPATCGECESGHQRLLSWSGQRQLWLPHSWQATGKRKEALKAKREVVTKRVLRKRDFNKKR